MRCLCLSGPALLPRELPRPDPGPGELLIRVFAAGVTTSEPAWYPSTHRKDGAPRAFAVPSHEFSGVVVAQGKRAAGEESGDMQPGQSVYGMNGWFSDGALADYCVAPVTSVAPKPLRLSHAEAASVPIGALTAWQGLFGRARLQAGERVLIHGGAGGVGVFAIQLAALHGAHVLATASPRNRDLVASLGAAQVIDYTRKPFEGVAGKVDVVFDTVGGETLERSWAVLRPGGRLATIVSEAAASPDPRVKAAFFIVEPNREQLLAIAERTDSGRLRAVVDSVVPFSEAPAVYSGLFRRRGQGKVVVAVAEAYAGARA